MSLFMACGISRAAQALPEGASGEISTFDGTRLAGIITSALRFMQPRTLEPHSIREFALWGLDGLTALDPAVLVAEDAPAPSETGAGNVEGRGHKEGNGPATIHVSLGQNVLGSFPVPGNEDLGGWSGLVAWAMETAWKASPIVRAAGADALLQSFFDELFNHLDPYSRYVAPAPAVRDRAARLGSDATVGITLDRSARGLVVSAVNANGPAWAAGVNTGDRVIAVNGHATRGISVDMVQAWLSGDAGTVVALTLAADGGRAQSISMRRALVPPETVFAYRKNGVTILRVTAFSTQTAEEMSQYIDQAMQFPTGPDKARGLILDLRGDRGGVLQQAVTAASLVLSHGVAVVTKGRDPRANHVWAVQGGDMTSGLPIVVMVDGRTASAAEILAAALSDHRRAVVIGSATLGKGLVQTIGQMPNGGELFVTWSRVVAPLGWPLQGLGIMPQLCTSRGAQDAHDQVDALGAGHDLEAPTVRASRAVRYPVPVGRILDIRRECPAAIGTDLDLDTALAILDSPPAYAAALATIPDDLGGGTP